MIMNGIDGTASSGTATPAFVISESDEEEFHNADASIHAKANHRSSNFIAEVEVKSATNFKKQKLAKYSRSTKDARDEDISRREILEIQRQNLIEQGQIYQMKRENLALEKEKLIIEREKLQLELEIIRFNHATVFQQPSKLFTSNQMTMIL